MSVQEIETAITRLPANELAELMTWLAAHHERVWDRQIEDDLESGRLNTLLTDVDQEYDAGLARPL